MCLPQLVVEQRQAFPDQLIQIEILELAAVHAREVQQTVHDFGSAEGLLFDLLEQQLAGVAYPVCS